MKDLSLPRIIGIILICLAGWIVGALWLGSIVYLWKIGQPRDLASPFLLYQYWTHYGHIAGVKFWVLTSAGGAGLVLLIPFIALLVPKARKLYGEVKLATAKTFKDAGMFKENGKAFFFMEFARKYVYGPSTKCISVILAAAPRSGKGTSQVQTNMFRLDCSVMITDIRQESYQITSGYRATFSEVHLINPFPSKARDENGKVRTDPETGAEIWEARSSRCNPFFYVPEDPGLRINALQKYANFLFPDPADGKEKFWAASSRSLFLGLSLYVFETEELPNTIGEVLRQAQSGGDSGDSISEHWSGIIKKRAAAGKPLSPSCVRSLEDFISTGGNTLTNIRKSLTSELDLWDNPIVDAMTSENDFDLRDMRKKKITVYLGVSPDNLSRARPLLSLIIQIALDLNMQEMPADDPRIKHPFALILDEFTALGRIEALAKSIGYLNGYLIMPYFIIQSFSQLRSVYGKDDAQTMIECCQLKIAFPPKSQEDAELLSKEIGNITESNKSVSVARGIFNNANSGSTSTSAAQRPFLLPQEMKALDPDTVIFLMEGMPPALGRKVHWWKTKVFKDRQRPPCVAPLLDYQAIIDAQAKVQAEKNGAIAPISKVLAPSTPETTPDFSSVAKAEMQPDFKAAPSGFDDLFSTPSPTASADILNSTHSEEAIENASMEEKTLSVPLRFSDYDMPLEEILAQVNGNPNGASEITPEILPVVESARFDLSDIMQDFSTVEIPQQVEITDEDLQNMLSGFFNKLPTATPA